MPGDEDPFDLYKHPGLRRFTDVVLPTFREDPVFVYAPYIPVQCMSEPKPRIEDYTSPFERALTPPAPPDPEVRIVEVENPKTAAMLYRYQADAEHARWESRQKRHQDAMAAARQRMSDQGYCHYCNEWSCVCAHQQ